MKKYIVLGVLLFTAMIIQSCSNNEYDLPYNDYASFTWWSSPRSTYNGTTKSIKANTVLAFQDVSKNALTHEWEIAEGTKFLSPFTEADTLDYSRFIKPDVGLVTNDALIYVLFQELGKKEIKIKNTFKDSIRGTIKINGVWTAQQIITVTVN